MTKHEFNPKLEGIFKLLDAQAAIFEAEGRSVRYFQIMTELVPLVNESGMTSAQVFSAYGKTKPQPEPLIAFGY